MLPFSALYFIAVVILFSSSIAVCCCLCSGVAILCFHSYAIFDSHRLMFVLWPLVSMFISYCTDKHNYLDVECILTIIMTFYPFYALIVL